MNRHGRRHGGITAQPLPTNVTVEIQYGDDGEKVMLITNIPVKTIRLTIEQAQQMIGGIQQAIDGLLGHCEARK